MQQRQEQVVCSFCGQQQIMTIYPHIDINMLPNLKQQVLNGELFSPECAHCEAQLALIYPCVYHDKQEKLLVCLIPFYQPGDEKTLKYDLFDTVEESYDYHLRVVTDFMSLVECIQLFYHRLDDRIYQIAKEVIRMQIQSQIIPRQLVKGYIQQNDEGLLHFNYVDDQQQSYNIALNHDSVTMVEDVYNNQWEVTTDFELIDFVWARQMIEAFE